MRAALPNAVMALASAALALVAAEALVRALDLGPSFHVVFRDLVEPSEDPLLEYALRPGAPDGATRISSAGLRDRDLPTAKPPGEFRIAAIGDSVTFGSGGPRERTWVDRLETLLAERARPGAPRIEVVNLGVPGYHAAQVVARLRSAGLPLDPDAIVYGYVLNDPQVFSLEGAALRAMQSEAERARSEAPRAGLLLRALAHSRLFLWSRALLAPPARTPAAMPSEPAYDAAAAGSPAAYFRALHAEPASAARVHEAFAALGAIARERGVPVLVAIFPLFPDDPSADPLRDVHALVATAARDAGLAVVDLAPVYAAARAAFAQRLHLDFLHPNGLGNRIAARAVLAALCREPAMLPRDGVDCAARGGATAIDVRVDDVVRRAFAPAALAR